jgi:amidophosphoribosyltransferase
MNYHSGILSLAHNGNLTNTITLRKKLEADGSIFQTTTDSELFLHMIARSREAKKIDQIREALTIARGAYSLVILTENSLVAACDPHGFRPLSIGRVKNEDGSWAYVVASETCAFDIISAEYVRPIEPNEIVVINQHTVETGEIESYKIMAETPPSKHCIFEYIYFSRPDSTIFGHKVDKVRRKLGDNLAIESPVVLDPDGKVRAIAVPDSGNTATLGFAKTNNEKYPTKYEIGFIRSHYVGRTFISPGQNNREFKVKVKFNTVRGVIQDKNIVLIDDSIVRGTTSRSLVNLVRACNPLSIHMRITSPPIKYPCYYGMDFPSRSELIANSYKSEKEIGDAIGVDTLRYLSLEQLLASVPQGDAIGYCTACFNGEYPVEIDKKLDKESAE